MDCAQSLHDGRYNLTLTSPSHSLRVWVHSMFCKYIGSLRTVITAVSFVKAILVAEKSGSNVLITTQKQSHSWRFQHKFSCGRYASVHHRYIDAIDVLETVISQNWQLINYYIIISYEVRKFNKCTVRVKRCIGLTQLKLGFNLYCFKFLNFFCPF